MPITLICLDADDTLWHNETYFKRTGAILAEVLDPFAPAEEVEARLDTVEHRNLSVYGYGAKGFVLSMIETALELAGDRLTSRQVSRILEIGKDMLSYPVEMLDGIDQALDALADRAQLVLLTKGDLYHQEAKLAASGLGERFTGVEIVSDKKPEIYRKVFARYGASPEEALMAGNSMRSDILPALEAGAYAAFIPFEIAWSHEVAEAPEAHERYRELARLTDLPEWVDELNGISCGAPAAGS